jgi:PAS domain S-box-containing protein
MQSDDPSRLKEKIKELKKENEQLKQACLLHKENESQGSKKKERASKEELQKGNQMLEQQKTILLQYKRMVEGSKDMMAAVDRNYKYLLVNTAFLEYHHLKNDEVIGYKVSEVLGEKVFREKIKPHLDKSMQGESVHFDMVKKYPGFGKLHLNINYYPLEKDGEVDGIVAVIRDITQYKQAEKEKYRSLKEFEITLKGLGSNQLFRYRKRSDHQYIVTFSEGEIAENFNFTTRQVKGKTLDEVMGKEHAGLLKTYFSRAFKGETVEYDFQIGERWFYTKLLPFETLSDGTVKEIIGTATEITQRKKAEQYLEESEEKHRFLFENMTQGVVYHKQNGEIFYANPSAANILGLTFDQLYGRTSIDPRWRVIHEDGSDFPGEHHPAMVTLKTGIPVYNKKMGVFNPKKNEYNWINTNSFPKLKENESQPYQVVATFEDITEREKTKRELKKAKEKAEESDRLKSVFLANMSHEIRTPMNGIMGFAQMLQEKEFPRDKQKKFLDIIHSSTQHLLNIINDLVDVSKIEAGQMTFNIQKFCLNDIMKELYSVYNHELKSKEKKHIHLKLQTALNDRKSYFDSDPSRFRQIMDNLLNNAIKFTHQGSVEFGYEFTSEGRLLFFVRDSGVGIPDEQQDDIFERFRQADDTTSKEYDGTGLGLTISKNLAELLGGKMWMESTEGEGSTFYFTLPYQNLEHGKSAVTSPQVADENVCRDKTILIIEDDPSSLEYLKELLESEEINIIASETGQEGYEAFLKNPQIDIILMDIKLPDTTGWELARKIRASGHRNMIPIIAQTAYAMSGDVQKSFDVGCNDYISKPVYKDTLLAKMHQLLGL